MAEVAPGVFVSSLEPLTWQRDPDVGGEAHVMFEEGSSTFGLWRADPAERRAPSPVEIPARESVVILTGSVRVGVDGTTLELSAGDMASLPAHAAVTWDASSDCKVIWAYH